MAVIHPFSALRPPPEKARQVSSVPYDVVNSEEAAALAAGNPLSFLHVSRPEIDLPDGTDLYSDAVYRKALENFHADFGRYPIANEGLAVLVRQPSTLAGWRGPYIEKDYSVDPWGNDYVYQVFNDGAGVILSTYGPEGEAAGRAFLQVHSGASRPSVTPKS